MKYIVLVISFVILFSFSAFAKVKKGTIDDIRLGSYSKYSRLVFDVGAAVDYKVVPDKKNGKVKLFLKNVQIKNEKLMKKRFNDSRVKSVKVLKTSGNNIEIDIDYRFIRDAIFYFQLKNPSRIVVDIKKRKQVMKLAGKKKTDIKNKPDGTDKAIDIKNLKKGENDGTLVRIYSSKEDKGSSKKDMKVKVTLKKIEVKEVKPEKVADIKKGAVEEKEPILANREAVSASPEEVQAYKGGLKLFQQQKYDESINAFEIFMSQFPNSTHIKDVFYVMAEAYYNIALKDKGINAFMRALDTYKLAKSKYPDDERNAMASYRIGKIYQSIDFMNEAELAYKSTAKEYHGTLYEQGSRFALAAMFLDNQNFTDAYNEFLRGVAINPINESSRTATFLFANTFVSHKDYIISTKLYADGIKKWPEFVKEKPEILFGMGMSFLENERFKEAKEAFFNIINLHSDSEYLEEAFLKIGDCYNKTGREKDSLKVYVEMIARDMEIDPEMRGRIKMANSGVEHPGIKTNNKIFDYDPYLKPVEEYQKIASDHINTLVGEEALFRKGVAQYSKNNYVDSVLTLKEMVDRYPESIFTSKSKIYLKDILFNLIDSYYSQDGYFPVLLTYHKNAEPFLQDITKKSILYKIGESYQKIGAYEVAEEMYRRLNRVDKRKNYKEKVRLRIAEINFARGEYAKAEKRLHTFLTDYKMSKKKRHAYKMYASSLLKQGKFRKAMLEYNKILKKWPKAQDRSEMFYYLAKSRYGLKEYISASKGFGNAIKMFRGIRGQKGIPFYITDSYYYKAESLYKAKKYKKAIPALIIALEKYPDDEWLRYLLAKSYEASKDNKKAKDLYAGLVSSSGGILSGMIKSDLKNMDLKRDKDLVN